MSLRRILVLVGTAGFGCATTEQSNSPAIPDPERQDSSGVTIVTNTGTDYPLDWRISEAFRLGGNPEDTSGFLQANAVAVADNGTIAVLERSSFRVMLFRANGSPLGAFGNQGQGPGEFRFPRAIEWSGDTLFVHDLLQRKLLQFDTTGSFVGLVDLSELGTFSRVVPSGGALYFESRGFVQEAPVSLVVARGGDLIVLETYRLPETRREAPDCGTVRSFAFDPIFAAPSSFAISGGRVVAHHRAAYSLSGFDATDGTFDLIVRRDVEPRASTPELTRQVVTEAITISIGGSGVCEITPEEILGKAAVAEVVPTVNRVTIDPLGKIWVERFSLPDERTRIDVFGARGAYEGTLEALAGFPSAFTPNGDPLVVVTDDLDVQRVVVYDIERT